MVFVLSVGAAKATLHYASRPFRNEKPFTLVAISQPPGIVLLQKLKKAMPNDCVNVLIESEIANKPGMIEKHLFLQFFRTR
jgi:hypothetical protein